jgi:hypothetical protein
VSFSDFDRLETGGRNLDKELYIQFHLKIKRQKREADNPPAFSAEVWNAWSFSCFSSFPRFVDK